MRILHTAHQLYAHITWTTEARSQLIDAPIQRELRVIINEIAEESGYEIIAFEAVSEHVHLLIRFKPTHSLSDFVKAIKGKSSRVIPYLLKKPISWQKGYSVTTVSPKALNTEVKYIKQQKIHHSDRKL